METIHVDRCSFICSGFEFLALDISRKCPIDVKLMYSILGVSTVKVCPDIIDVNKPLTENNKNLDLIDG